MTVDSGRTFAFLSLAGLGGYATCLVRHWCQCGHMEHPPYGWFDYALDATWVVLFVGAGLMAFVRWGSGGWTWFLLLSGLIATRFALPHTLGLSVIAYEIPVSIALTIQSIWVVVTSFRTILPPLDEYDEAQRVK